MDLTKFSRRGLLFAGAGLALADGAPTAGQIIDRIKQNVGVPWRAETVDRFVAGNGDSPVKRHRHDDDGDARRGPARGGGGQESGDHARTDVLAASGHSYWDR